MNTIESQKLLPLVHNNTLDLVENPEADISDETLIVKKTKVVTIQEQLLKDLVVDIQSHNEVNKPKLKLDVAVFFLSLLNSIPTYIREEDRTGVVRLDSQRLRMYNRNYIHYMNFLTNKMNPFITMVKSYGKDTRTCKTFILNDKYALDDLKSYSITNKILLKTFDRKGRDAIQIECIDFCQDKRPHLVKFFDDNLSIDSINAHNEIRPLLESKVDKIRRKGVSAKVIIDEFQFKEWKYSIKEDTDNRLHSNLTRSPKILRRYIRYNGERIVGADIKTSQPFFLSIIIKAILNKDRGHLERIGANNVISYEAISELFNLELDRNELIKFVQIILEGDLYNEFEKHLSIKINKDGLPYRHKVSKRKKKYYGNDSNDDFWVNKPYDSNRDLVKTVIMEAFYSSTNSKVSEVAKFRKVYKSVIKIIKCFEESNIKLHRVLQYIESHILLDCVAVEIHEKYPAMPLFSIHDSLVTTTAWIDILKEEMIERLSKTASITPSIELEYWDYTPL